MSTQGSISKDASGRWFFIVDVPSSTGKRKQLKRRGFSTKKDAQAELTKLLGDAQRGSFVQPTRLRVGPYLREWLAGLPAAGRRPSTIEGYRQVLDRHVIPGLGGHELQALRATHLDVLYSALLETGLAKSTVRKIHTVLGKALADAERKEIVPRNVARLATPPSASSAKAPEMSFWTPAQLRVFLDRFADHQHYPMLRTAALTGLRRGELCGLRWKDVDLDAGTLTVRQTITSVAGQPVLGDVKTSRSRRVVDLDPTTIGVLRAWRQTQREHRVLMGAGWSNTGLVFTTPLGDGWHPKTVSQAFDRLVTPPKPKASAEGGKVRAISAGRQAKRADRDRFFELVPRIRLHDLRHTHASHLLAAGVNVKVVASVSGTRAWPSRSTPTAT